MDSEVLNIYLFVQFFSMWLFCYPKTVFFVNLFIRQCLCCLRDSKNYDQFYWVVQSIITILVTKLKEYKGQDEITCINISTTKDITREDTTPSELKTEQVNTISSNESPVVEGISWIYFLVYDMIFLCPMITNSN
jgi:hypothetical protein